MDIQPHIPPHIPPVAIAQDGETRIMDDMNKPCGSIDQTNPVDLLADLQNKINRLEEGTSESVAMAYLACRNWSNERRTQLANRLLGISEPPLILTCIEKQ